MGGFIPWETFELDHGRLVRHTGGRERQARVVEQAAPSRRRRRPKAWVSARPAGPARSLTAEEIARLGLTPPRRNP